MSKKIMEKANDDSFTKRTMPIIANVVAIFDGQQTETIDMDQMELNLKSESLQNSLDRHLIPLRLELNCQFECLKVPIQRKFIYGLGRGIYGMFRQKVLTKVGLKN
jgi:hypothetical protein